MIQKHRIVIVSFSSYVISPIVRFRISTAKPCYTLKSNRVTACGIEAHLHAHAQDFASDFTRSEQTIRCTLRKSWFQSKHFRKFAFPISTRMRPSIWNQPACCVDLFYVNICLTLVGREKYFLGILFLKAILLSLESRRDFPLSNVVWIISVQALNNQQTTTPKWRLWKLWISII